MPRLDPQLALSVPTQADCVVIGGGPAGACFAALVRRHAPERSIVILDSARAARWHAGEASIPTSSLALHELELLDRVREAGVEVSLGDDADLRINVLRSRFDGLLLDRAAELGTIVRCGHAVVSVDHGTRSKELRWRRLDGREGRIQADFVLDASGPAQVMTRGTHTLDDTRDSVATVGYFDRGSAPATTHVLEARGGWIWIAPVSDELVSVGVVTDRQQHRRALQRVSPERWFLTQLRRSRRLWPLLRGRRLRDDVLPGGRRVLTERSVPSCSRKPVGEGWAAVGSAALCVHPVAATRVATALHGGQRAAQTYLATLARDAMQAGELWQRYAAELQATWGAANDPTRIAGVASRVHSSAA